MATKEAQPKVAKTKDLGKKKEAEAKVAKNFWIDCSKPVEDKVFIPSNFAEFLRGIFKRIS